MQKAVAVVQPDEIMLRNNWRPFLNFEISNSDTLRRVLTKFIFCYGVFCPIHTVEFMFSK
ncbi:hypothetical protein T4D_15282 [Trichinella pseudospiralis]|uniref:Uncharacterized protein n=1 Tax=Trichinella pseudospiralis TaxID=6337 RepID=A0A0V1FI58_TRIPS|nr:hypothetical protein T4D_15282 [Trichinella pseudospiralis]